ncbi:iris-like [Haemaphysalis longicornis]
MDSTISPSSSVCFLSVLDFRGSWKLPFDDCTCTRDVFHESATVSSDVLMIHMSGHFRVAHCTDLMARALELPYQPPGGGDGSESDSDTWGTSTPSLHADAPLPASNTLALHSPAHTEYVMVVLLPDEELDSMVGKLSTVTLLRILSQLRPKGDVHVSLPLFKVKQMHDLGPALSELGVVDAFSERAELWGAAAGELRVSSLRHAASFEVAQMAGRPKPRRKRHNEEDKHGTSVTQRIASLMKPSLVHEPVHFIVNKPFVFLVLAKRPDTFLMLGSMRKVAW